MKTPPGSFDVEALVDMVLLIRRRAPEQRVAAVTSDRVARVAATLIAAGWDRRSAEQAAPGLVETMTKPCPCGGRGERSCRLTLSDPRHGKRNGYVNQGCACDDCTTANTRYVTERRAQAA